MRDKSGTSCELQSYDPFADSAGPSLEGTLHGHGRYTCGVCGLAVLPDGHVAASSSSGLHLWRIDTGELLGASLDQDFQDGQVKAIAVHGDGRQFVTGSQNGALWIWDSTSRKGRRIIEGFHQSEWFDSFAFSSDAHMVVGVSANGTLRLCDLETGEELRCFTDRDSVGTTALSMLAGGRGVLCGSFDGALRLWDSGPGEVFRRIAGHRSAIRTITALLDGGDRVLVSSYDGNSPLRLYDLATRASRLFFRPLHHGYMAEALSLLRDGRRWRSACSVTCNPEYVGLGDGSVSRRVHRRCGYSCALP